jgi:hypothetical protein
VAYKINNSSIYNKGKNMNNDFYIGQIFENTYPPMAAIWCNANNAHIADCEDGKCQIVANEPTEQQTEKTTKKKSKRSKGDK